MPDDSFQRFIASLLLAGLMVTVLVLAWQDRADGQPICETWTPDPGLTVWETWRPFPHLEVVYSDGATDLFTDIPAGVLITAPEGASIEEFTKCDSPSPSPTPTPSVGPTTTPATPTPTTTPPSPQPATSPRTSCSPDCLPG